MNMTDSHIFTEITHARIGLREKNLKGLFDKRVTRRMRRDGEIEIIGSVKKRKG